jgi:hypothetical protein
MTQILRQSTQVVVRVGPFYDLTDGVTPETGVTLGAADQAELLKAAGAATVDIAARTFAAITGCDGYYDLTLTTTDTNTIGTLEVVVHDASVHRALPAQRFQVVEEAVYDALYVSGASPATPEDISAAVMTDINSGEADPIEAIKEKTDDITFSVANMVDANIQAVNNVTVTGTGVEGSDPWGP